MSRVKKPREKVVWWLPKIQGWKIQEVTDQEYSVPSWAKENVLKLIVAKLYNSLNIMKAIKLST